MNRDELLMIALAVAGLVGMLILFGSIKLASCRQAHPSAPASYCWMGF